MAAKSVIWSKMSSVSVIIPCWNRAAFLDKAIASVLGQSYADFELLVVDDGSSDNTPTLLAGYGAKIKVIWQARGGPSAARNAGIRQARGEFIAFLDSDDWWHRDKLAEQVKAMRAAPSYMISHTDEIWYRRGVLLPQKKKHLRPHGHIFANCLPICCVGMSTVMVRRDFFSQVGLFAEDLPCCEDYDLWLRAAVRLPFLKIDKALTCKEGGRDDQVSQHYRQGMDRFRIKAMGKLWSDPYLTTSQRQLLLAELSRKCRIYGNGCRKHGKEDEARYYLNFVQHLQGPSV